MTKTIISICLGGLVFAVFNYIAPMYAEYKSKEDVKDCAPYEPIRGKTGVLYCQCSDSERQKPGRCEDKYK